jgi:alpha-D-ribose 1-methylphosphonate 5-triphosphate diphosphatase
MDEVFTNARIVLKDQVIHGTVTTQADTIRSVDEGHAASHGLDLEGDYLIPGLIELHTDNLENHYEPRKRVYWDPVQAAVNHDAVIATSGVTTVFDALCIGLADKGQTRNEHMIPMISGIRQARAAGMLRADHRLHLRCEVIGSDVLEQIEAFEDSDGLLGIVSLMDHAPGQRQTADVAYWRTYTTTVLGMSEADAESEYVRLRHASEKIGPAQRRTIAKWARQSGRVLASHDDETVAHVEESRDLGCTIAEFPTTLAAAEASRAAGLAILMGAPNLVRGKSTSGNVTAVELAERGLLDILSSDYVPASLIPAAFKLADSVVGWSLPRAIATMTDTPARTVGLNDRGRIEPGLRADLVRVRVVVGGLPVVRGVWRAGERVA